MARVGIEDALDYCLANPDGLSAEELLNSFPEYRDELQSLLAISTDLAAVAPPPVSADRRAAMKQRLMTAAATQQATQSVPVTPARPQPAIPNRQRMPWFLALLRRPAFAIAAVVILLFGTVWSASANSLPGSPFYSVKLTSENVLLNFAGSVADKVRGHIDLANVRLSDLQTMQNRNDLAKAGPAFTSYDYHLNNGTALWNSTTGDTHTELARILYASSVAGQYTFGTLKGALANAPTGLQSDYDRTVKALNDLNTNTAQVLKTAHIDPATLVQPGAPELADVAARAHIEAHNLLTPVPAISPFVTNQSGTPVTTGGSATPAVQATPAQTSSALALAPSISAPTALPGTPRVLASATRAATNTARATSTIPRANATATLTTEKPAPQASPTRRSTPRPVATLTRAVVPSATSRPPMSTPTRRGAATNTPLSTSTSVPASTPAPPLIRATVTSTTSCDITVTSLTTSCDPQSCLGWAAVISNNGSDRVKATWVAELQIKGANDDFHTVASDNKKVNLAQGVSNISGSFCFSFPADVTAVRVKLVISADTGACAASATSDATAPCRPVTPTPRPQPTHEPTRQPTAPPESTGEPHPTREVHATSEPHKTQGPEETKEPDGGPDPSPPVHEPQPTHEPKPTREP